MKRIFIFSIIFICVGLLVLNSQSFTWQSTSEKSLVPSKKISKADDYDGWLQQQRAYRHSKNVIKIPIEEYKGNLENLPEGAFVKEEKIMDLKSGKSNAQTYVFLQKENSDRH